MNLNKLKKILGIYKINVKVNIELKLIFRKSLMTVFIIV
jgi:hypothetical protein